jgi:hypothetical protein
MNKLRVPIEQVHCHEMYEFLMAVIMEITIPWDSTCLCGVFNFEDGGTEQR